jgi:DMSO reductase family type II enzyme heme b subunit
VVKARLRAGALPADPFDKAWEAAEPLDVLLAGQIILEPRWFKPAHDVVTVRALYNEREVALMLTWDDGTHNKGDGDRPADQAAIQLPLGRDAMAEKPYFLLGDRNHPVDYWRWSAARGLARQVFSGHDRPAEHDAAGLTADGSYRDGQYRVIFRRALAAAASKQLTFTPGEYVPVAFHLWDGAQGEDGLRMAISAWHYLLLEPALPLATYLWPGGVGAIVLAGELWLLRRQRGRRRTPAKRGTS